MRPSSGTAGRLLSDRLGAKRDRASARGRRHGPCARLSSATCTPTVRPRRSTSPGGGSPSRRSPRPGCSARWPTRWSASKLSGQPGWTLAGGTATPPGPRRGPACCPISTPTSSRVSPGIACTGGGRRPRAHPGGPGQNYRSCWPAAWSAGCGIRGAPSAEHPDSARREPSQPGAVMRARSAAVCAHGAGAFC